LLPNAKFDRRHLFTLRRIRAFVILIPFLVKIPVFGLHFWLPKAHVEASTRGSMILAGLLLKLGRYGVTQMFFIVKLVSAKISLTFWLLISLISRIVTLTQTDIKKLIAYRRVTHITFLILGITRGGKIIILRVLITSLAHG
jgi:NADH:ubiquinone oxidoreductase subunit 4 (subunit M)